MGSPARLRSAGACLPHPRAAMRSWHWTPSCRRGAEAMAALIEMQKITKTYRGAVAVKDIDFDLQQGEIHALLGENGAGKSTLTKIMAGVVGPTSGTMRFGGEA